MLDMGFHDDIMRIITKTADLKQTLMFSATYPDGIKKISDILQSDPVDIRVEFSHHSPDIDQTQPQPSGHGKDRADSSVSRPHRIRPSRIRQRRELDERSAQFDWTSEPCFSRSVIRACNHLCDRNCMFRVRTLRLGFPYPES